MVYEVFGIPGAGKTTFCKLLEKQYNIKNPMNFYRNNMIGKILFHIFLKFYFLDNDLRNVMNDMKRILGQKIYKKNIFDSKIELELYLKYLLFSYYIGKIYKQQNIVIDEGAIHFLIAIYAEFEVEIEKIVELIEYFELKDSKEYIYLKSTIDNAIKQSKERGRKRATIDFLNQEELFSLYNKYLHMCELINRKMKCISENDAKEKLKLEMEKKYES